MSKFSLTIFALLVLVLAGTFIGHRWQNDRLKNTQDRLATTDDQIIRVEQRLSVFSAATPPELNPNLIWKTDGTQTPAQIMQSWMIDTLRSQTLDIRQYTQLPATQMAEHPALFFRVEFVGPLAGLATFLADLESARPAVAVETMQIRALPARDQRDGETRVATILTIWGLTDEPR